MRGLTGNDAWRQVSSASPMQPKKPVTFEETSMDSNTEATPETADWSQPIEVDDPLPPSGTPEVADWSQTEEVDLGVPPTLDLKVEEFLSGEKLEYDPDVQDHSPNPPFTPAHNWVAWQAEQVTTPT